MRDLQEIKNNPLLKIVASGEDGMEGFSKHNGQKWAFTASWGLGWEHLSISGNNITPNWETMCHFKSIFFKDDEVCVEYHPKKSEYVNMMPYCLHIWKPQHEELPTPPSFMIGLKDGENWDALAEQIEAYTDEYIKKWGSVLE